jgi:hypothetical protein
MNDKFVIIYDSELVIPDTIVCDIIVDGKPATTMDIVRQDLDSKLSIHVITKEGKEILLNQYNVIKITYNI